MKRNELLLLSLSLQPLMMYLSFSDCHRFRRAAVTSAARRHHRRRLLKYSPNHLSTTPAHQPAIFKLSDDTLQINLKSPSTALQKLDTKLREFVDLGREALDDLRTTVAVDASTGAVVISCRRSTVEFFSALFVSGLVLVIVFGSLFRMRESGGEVLIYKRDRSLGGKEVVVGKREDSWPTRRPSATPLSSENGDYYDQSRRNGRNNALSRRKKEELPQWWLKVVSQGPVEVENKDEYQRLANQLIQVIMDRKMNGEDISTNEIVQLRHLCKTYGVRAFISTENARNSLYRVSVNFVLDYCASVPDLSSSIEINGEGVREFIAGFSNNLGLDSYHAARMVSAAVAARTRSKILQAWALEVQNKHSEALVELFKVCLIHRIFPPEENSPEMEMVARSLDKSLNIDQREHLLNSFISVCGDNIDQGVVEALGLVSAKVMHTQFGTGLPQCTHRFF
ncbi:uncharacterized protein LOC121803624 [Salvia splendens]|uniref:uncharacterized protein LOC121803624 n=1 Tax=Salvia splendens TaxID=180675 RepID=UPI001C27B57F|nr:uncharacterized protein LOC121803624 [Salvia splendens]